MLSGKHTNICYFFNGDRQGHQNQQEFSVTSQGLSELPKQLGR